jgi:transposase
MIEEAKDITLNEMVLRLEEKSVSIGRSALDVWLRKRGWTFKKDRSCTGAGTSRPSEAAGMVRRSARSRPRQTRLH